MKLLFSVYLPLLPLEAQRPCWSEPAPFAVIDGGAVLAMSGEVAHAGVRVGMRAGGVAAVAPQTQLLERTPDREAQAMQAVATALMQYTPEVALQDDCTVLLDVSASLRLFNGPHAFSASVLRSVAALGYSAMLGAAPTAAGAWLLAHSPRLKGLHLRRRVLSMALLKRRLDQLPCGLLPAAAPFHDWLQDIGAKHIGALRRLPRAGLLRRTSAEVLGALDRAYGEAAEMHEWITPPLRFSARVETFDRVEHAEALLHGATSLIVQLIGWLVSLQQAVRVFTLLLEHERGRAALAPTAIEVALAEPAWQAPHLLRLLKERLAKVVLERPVIALRLEVQAVEAMLPPNDSLFPEPGGSPQDYARLLELLRARLGPDNVLVPVDLADHRPEVCNAWVPATVKRPQARVEEIFDGRPFWLLPQQIRLRVHGRQPFYATPLRLIDGPERLEAGWWNDQTAARDYYVAQAGNATCYWIYRERIRDEVCWYLHGLFG